MLARAGEKWFWYSDGILFHLDIYWVKRHIWHPKFLCAIVTGRVWITELVSDLLWQNNFVFSAHAPAAGNGGPIKRLSILHTNNVLAKEIMEINIDIDVWSSIKISHYHYNTNAKHTEILAHNQGDGQCHSYIIVALKNGASLHEGSIFSDNIRYTLLVNTKNLTE